MDMNYGYLKHIHKSSKVNKWMADHKLCIVEQYQRISRCPLLLWWL